MNKEIKLAIIPEPKKDTRQVLKMNLPYITFFKSTGHTNYLCGNCNAMLALSIHVEQINGFVLKCNSCGLFNDATVHKLSSEKAN